MILLEITVITDFVCLAKGREMGCSYQSSFHLSLCKSVSAFYLLICLKGIRLFTHVGLYVLQSFVIILKPIYLSDDCFSFGKYKLRSCNCVSEKFLSGLISH